jgi:hypothetical protein
VIEHRRNADDNVGDYAPDGATRLAGIVTIKDTFKAMITNQNSMTEILNDKSFISHKELIERRSESWKRW